MGTVVDLRLARRRAARRQAAQRAVENREDAMRFLLPAIGIIVLIGTWYALQTRFSPNHIAEAGASLGIPVYGAHANKRDTDTLQEQWAPLP